MAEKKLSAILEVTGRGELLSFFPCAMHSDEELKIKKAFRKVIKRKVWKEYERPRIEISFT